MIGISFTSLWLKLIGFKVIFQHLVSCKTGCLGYACAAKLFQFWHNPIAMSIMKKVFITGWRKLLSYQHVFRSSQYLWKIFFCFILIIICLFQIPQSNEGKPWFSYVDSELTSAMLEGLCIFLLKADCC